MGSVLLKQGKTQRRPPSTPPRTVLRMWVSLMLLGLVFGRPFRFSLFLKLFVEDALGSNADGSEHLRLSP